ncbi:hypothetical protein SLEP1_g30716 [Rubroshorea leprosula]|uniref:Uncharacterized protein n=1 Tax=Rubroshorea leprosula TaxID=152421 RepID=A0AAV5K951_9ROSI|nr:hypothetical protein SLEP1_g30716 [Rubroshorea leprosula]
MNVLVCVYTCSCKYVLTEGSLPWMIHNFLHLLSCVIIF